MKTVRLGTIDIGDKKPCDIYCKITIDDGRLSISGVEGPKVNGDCLGSCGQIDMRLRDRQDEIKLAPGWTSFTLAKFFYIWQRWHLNDLRAECEHQRLLGWKWTTHASEVCPTCGYKLGHAWLREELPNEVIEFLQSLPDTDKHPAWV